VSFVFCLAFGHWALAADWGEKRKREGKKKEKKEGPKGTKRSSSSAKSFFLLCSSSPLHNFTRSFLLSFLDKREQKRKGSQKNSTRTHAHSFTRTRTARTLSKATFPFFMEELEPSFGTFKRE
jgi:hypothetical protein